MTVKVLTNVRADDFFMDLWIRYYGDHFGRENLHIMLDGEDWQPNCDVTGVNLHVVTDVPRIRADRLKYTAIWQSRLAARFLKKHQCSVVLRTDIDEFVALDPRAGTDLHSYIAGLRAPDMAAALGVDMIQAQTEQPLANGLPILEQRRNGVVTREYCKLVAVTQPLRWCGGFHRGRNTEIDIKNHLLLFHLALFDKNLAEDRITKRKSIAEHATQGAHIAGRLVGFDQISATDPLDFDDISEKAARQVMKSKPSRGGPHPGFITDGNVPRGYHVRLPERFGALLPLPYEGQAPAPRDTADAV